MRILFDQGTPVPLRALLVGHTINTAREMGWADLDMAGCLQRQKNSSMSSSRSTRTSDTSRI
jgi:hypothetical protein